MGSDKTTACLFRRYQAGDDNAATEIVGRYAKRLCALAESQLERRLQTRIDPEGVVQSVFRTLFRRSRAGLLKIDRTGPLWNLMAEYTRKRVRKRVERERAQCRDARREVSTEPDAFDRMADDEPSPEDATIVSELVDRIASELGPRQTRVLRGLLERRGVDEIAKEVECSRWTVQRIRERIQNVLVKLDSPES